MPPEPAKTRACGPQQGHGTATTGPQQKLWPLLWSFSSSRGAVNPIGKRKTPRRKVPLGGRGKVSGKRGEEGELLEKEECCDRWSGRNGVRGRRGVEGSEGVRCLRARDAAGGCGAFWGCGSVGLFSVRFIVFGVFAVGVERVKPGAMRVGRRDRAGGWVGFRRRSGVLVRVRNEVAVEEGTVWGRREGSVGGDVFEGYGGGAYGMRLRGTSCDRRGGRRVRREAGGEGIAFSDAARPGGRMGVVRVRRDGRVFATSKYRVSSCTDARRTGARPCSYLETETGESAEMLGGCDGRQG